MACHVFFVLYLWYYVHILVFPRAVINTIYLFNNINVIINNMIYYVLASTYVHLFMFSY